MLEVLGIEEAPGWSKCMMKVMKGHTLRVNPFAKSAISEKLFSDGRCTEGSTSSHPLLLPVLLFNMQDCETVAFARIT